MGEGYDHRKHPEAEGHQRHNNSSEASIKRAADWLRAKNIGALVVTSENAVLGLISEREIVHAFLAMASTAGSMPVKEIMQRGVTTVSPDESVNRVMNLMTRDRARHVPVLRGSKLAGIVSIGDVVKHRLEDLELETTSYVMSTSPRVDGSGVGCPFRSCPATAPVAGSER